MPLGVETLAVERDDAAAFLAAMLQGVQTERGENCGVFAAEDAEHAAFLSGFIVEPIVGRLRFRRILIEGAVESGLGTGCSFSSVAANLKLRASAPPAQQV